MRRDAAPSDCEVVGCHQPAADAYLHAVAARLVEFGMCTEHYRLGLSGGVSVVVAGSFDLTDVDGRAIVVVAPPV